MKTHKKFVFRENMNIIISITVKFLLFGVSLFCFFNIDDKTTLGIVFAAFFFLSVLVALISHFAARKKDREIQPLLKNITTDFLHDMYIPIAITNEFGNILWYNDAFSESFSIQQPIFNESVSNVLKSDVTYSLAKNREKIFSSELQYDEKSFEMNIYKISSNGTVLNVFIFDECTEINNLKQEMQMKDPVIAYFVIDNISEIAQTMQDKYRRASGAVSDLLKEWTEKNGGVIKEYEKDKYLCFFENKSLKAFVKNRFSVLDDVRNIKIEDMSMPVTVSAGVSGIEGTMAEKDAVAKQALDFALQRGGDQAAVKGEHSTVFYGGKTKTVQKKTKIRSRVVATQLEEFIQTSDNILIMGHKYADNDSIGACVGIARLVLSLGKKANIVVNIHDKNLKSSFMRLRGIQEYKDMFTDSTTANDIITSNTGLIVADVNNPFHFESEELYKIIPKVAVIDHHRKTTEFMTEPHITYIEPSASSTCELLAEILEQSLAPGELLKEEAELLLAGIILDTKQFSQNTGTKTFSAALYLRGEGGNPSEAVSIFNTGVEEFTKEAKFESNVKIYRNSIAIAVLPTEGTIADKNACAKAADKLLKIDGVSASFSLFKAGDTVHISARSLGTVNVQLIAEAMGGGGHYDAAGTQVKNATVKEVLAMLQKNIDEYMDGVS